LTFVCLQINLFGLRITNKLSSAVAKDICARLVSFYLNPSFILKIKIKLLVVE
jgi:hypothetical protein